MLTTGQSLGHLTFRRTASNEPHVRERGEPLVEIVGGLDAVTMLPDEHDEPGNRPEVARMRIRSDICVQEWAPERRRHAAAPARASRVRVRRGCRIGLFSPLRSACLLVPATVTRARSPSAARRLVRHIALNWVCRISTLFASAKHIAAGAGIVATYRAGCCGPSGKPQPPPSSPT